MPPPPAAAAGSGKRSLVNAQLFDPEWLHEAPSEYPVLVLAAFSTGPGQGRLVEFVVGLKFAQFEPAGVFFEVLAVAAVEAIGRPQDALKFLVIAVEGFGGVFLVGDRILGATFALKDRKSTRLNSSHLGI